MAKKQSYDAYLRQQMGELIDQLDLPKLYKQSLKDRWLDQMIWADKKASQCQKSYYRLRLITIVGGVLLPALVGVSMQMGQNSKFFRVWFPPLTFALSQVIAVSVAIEEFCKFGDRWRDYRKLAEDLKSEGWQYLQSSGAYEYGAAPVQPVIQRSNGFTPANLSLLSSDLALASSGLNGAQSRRQTHLENFAQFANRIETLIKDDVQSYVSELMKQQAKQDAESQKILVQAQAVASNKALIAQLDPNYPDPTAPPQNAPQRWGTPGTPAYPGVAAIGAAGSLRTRQDTQFKLSTQPSQTLPDAQKVAVGPGATFGLMSYAIADHNHVQVTLNQGLGPENRNTWFVYTPHVEIIGVNGQPTSIAPAAPVGAPTAAPAVAFASADGQPTATPAATPAVAVQNGAVQLAVPYYSQLDNTENPFGSCNVTSVAMCLTYLGAKQTNPQKQFEDELQDWLAARGLDRHEPQALAQAVEGYGCQDRFVTNATLEQVKQWLAQGNPAVTHGYFTSSGHIVCIIGYNDKGLIINDPYGEWHADGYDRNDSSNPEKGKAVTYSYDMIQTTCMTGGEFWVHFISRPGSTPAAAQAQPAGHTSAAPAQTSATQATQRITAEQLIQIAGANAPHDRLRQLISGVNQTLEKYQITTPLRIAHFIAQVAHESDCFNAMEEYASGEDYEGRSDLGNTQPGDGVRFKGRGLIQLTGRSNYGAFSKAIGVDCVAKPEIVAQSPYAVLAAGWFWDNNNINPLADQDDVEAVTRRINGGLNGIDDRRSYLQRAKSVLHC